jgi:NADH dehydrogenase FAD-containing subunit
LNGIDDVSKIGDAAEGHHSMSVFQYRHLGSMASVGQWKGVFDAPSGKSYTVAFALNSKSLFSFSRWSWASSQRIFSICTLESSLLD